MRSKTSGIVAGTTPVSGKRLMTITRMRAASLALMRLRSAPSGVLSNRPPSRGRAVDRQRRIARRKAAARDQMLDGDRIGGVLVGELLDAAGDDIGGGDDETDLARCDPLEVDIARQRLANGPEVVEVRPGWKREEIRPRPIERRVAEHREAALDLLRQEGEGDGSSSQKAFSAGTGFSGWLATIAAVNAPMETPETHVGRKSGCAS